MTYIRGKKLYILIYHHLADSIRSISPFWLYIDTIFFAYDGMCLSALHPQMMEKSKYKVYNNNYNRSDFLFDIPLLSPGTIYMKVISDSVVIQGITGEFETLGANL